MNTYFEKSEQILTLCDFQYNQTSEGTQFRGFLLQKMPENNENALIDLYNMFNKSNVLKESAPNYN
jgi:redox-regulated HSP33 family molecular chaperone